MVAKMKTKNYYSAHRGEFWHISISVHSDHYDVDRILVGLSCELHCRIERSSDGGPRGDKRAHNSATKVSFCTIIIRLCHCMIAITTV